ncbi:RidA family protein [Cellulomonas fimi]|uniref:Endoribonuclease L-PSP n=1 Tax=Cellulomonas fimi (strain ATCC 484 / DSM 20113 / JCM 1341 / CCUG 24087 / LMG 16345 / NBRC 15513 / NCIMB 8980 / NCTC 7547 / NRS-133) TaxID=590998 RepID=F4H4N1_CELFA|nr:RidA family protein [Cellulomonas fimi]AEE44232.1 Endoribonuclease L-PSP [Cellulomonas fimi ATCC 484]NNH05679.1 RidA family protein [Cellulomonas fimi]VEH25934.1 pyrimidine utilization protein C [Cellulomonas fimi]
MITRLPSHVGDPTCASVVRAGGFLFLAHHAGGFERRDYAHQTRATLHALGETLRAAGAGFEHVVQVTLWLREYSDETRAAWDVFGEVFGDAPPARMTATTDFFDPACLVMVDAVAYVGD